MQQSGGECHGFRLSVEAGIFDTSDESVATRVLTLVDGVRLEVPTPAEVLLIKLRLGRLEARLAKPAESVKPADPAKHDPAAPAPLQAMGNRP